MSGRFALETIVMPMAPNTARPKGFVPYAARAQQRPSARARGYDSAWEALRKQMIEASPACVTCGSTDRLNVDHKISVAEAPERRLDPTNLQVLCQSCHSGRTSRDHSWNGRRPGPTP